MKRVYIICEGQTEESFVNQLLQSYFIQQNIFVQAPLIGKPGHKGGNVNLPRLLKDLAKILNGDRSAYCTTLLDYYGLPSDFPGKEEADQQNDLAKKNEVIHTALHKAVEDKLGAEVASRFIPYIQMYEFEALLFSDPKLMESKLKTKGFVAIRESFDSPEHINNSPQTAPSKRILKLYPAYNKVLDSSVLAQNITLDIIRKECLLFDGWLSKISNL